MSARGFGSVLWAGAVAGAALGFYLVSLNVASERAKLEDVETKIALAHRDIRLLQTEIGTRGRLAQLERWNVKFIRLSAPTADQFVDGGFHLASLVAPQRKPAIEAPVVLASARIESPAGQSGQGGDAASAGEQSRQASASEMMHVASYSIPEAPAGKPAVAGSPVPKPRATARDMDKMARTDAATKQPKSAVADPLAPLPTAKPGAKGGKPASATGGTTSQIRTLKDRVTD